MKISDLPDDTQEQLRDVSRAMWNSGPRLELLHAVATSKAGRVFAHGLAKDLNVTDRVAGEELRRLERAGLLRLVEPDDPGQKRRYYDRCESCFWAWVEAFVSEVTERSETELAPPLRLPASRARS